MSGSNSYVAEQMELLFFIVLKLTKLNRRFCGSGIGTYVCKCRRLLRNGRPRRHIVGLCRRYRRNRTDHRRVRSQCVRRRDNSRKGPIRFQHPVDSHLLPAARIHSASRRTRTRGLGGRSLGPLPPRSRLVPPPSKYSCPSRVGADEEVIGPDLPKRDAGGPYYARASQTSSIIVAPHRKLRACPLVGDGRGGRVSQIARSAVKAGDGRRRLNAVGGGSCAYASSREKTEAVGHPPPRAVVQTPTFEGSGGVEGRVHPALYHILLLRTRCSPIPDVRCCNFGDDFAEFHRNDRSQAK
ncbi:unnamed protein product [Nesidiocoris tenuis]|uniref:Uncharacterized protein n=1 Tax=Nesidiocoris tenuis TaxID=355587 RepID=A0A6H5G4D6_9HEMI|nr:unnamed protein product [Nesidiocoris tenuis]